jgi:hypothetical protein
MGDSVILPKWINRGNVVIGVLALVTAYLAVELDRSKQTCESLSKENSLLNRSLSGKTAPLLVCARDIPAGTIISMDMVDTKIVPSSSFPCDSFDNIYVAVGREMLCSQKKGEPLHSQSLGFGFGSYGTDSIEASKKFNSFIGLAKPSPAEFTLGEHKVAITSAWLEQAHKSHILAKDPEFYIVSFTLTVDGNRPHYEGKASVYFKPVGEQNGFDEYYDYADGSATGTLGTLFHLKCPAKSITTTLPIKIFIGDIHSTNKLHPTQPSQIVTFTLPPAKP